MQPLLVQSFGHKIRKRPQVKHCEGRDKCKDSIRLKVTMGCRNNPENTCSVKHGPIASSRRTPTAVIQDTDTLHVYCPRDAQFLFEPFV